MRTMRSGTICVALLATVLIVGVPSPASARVVPGSADRIGHWDAPFQETAEAAPIGQAMAVLRDGRLFYFQGVEGYSTRRGGGARLLDLRSGIPGWTGPSPSTGEASLFCSDLAMLGDGRILMAGGGEDASLLGGEGGAPRAPRIFNPGTGSLSLTGAMRRPRWYPGLVTLSDGKALVAGGLRRLLRGTDSSPVSQTESYDPASDTWTENHGGAASETSLPPQPRLFLMPNGKVFYPAVGQTRAPDHAEDAALWGMQRFFDPASGEWEIAGPAPWGMRDTATSVLLPLDPPYDKATILTFGGTAGPAPAGGLPDSLSTLTTVDRSGRVTNNLTGPTRNTRRFSSAVSLPDGTVLALGGASADSVAGNELPARSVEIFAPWAPPANGYSARGGWFAMATPSRDRTHHNSAVLLPDGRVLLGGHAPTSDAPAVGGPFAGNEADSSFEVYSPPYLFRGPRPSIRHAPAGIRWGETFSIDTAQALGIESVVLMRLPSPQHVSDSDARTVRLRFTRAHSGRLRVQAPPDGAVAPPGYYYLFVNRRTAKGMVPSVARLVRVGARGDLSDAYQPYPDDPPAPQGSASFAASRSLASTLWQGAGDQTGKIPGPAVDPCRLAWGREGAGC